MGLETSPIAERGLLTLSDNAWELANRRNQIIAPLAALDIVGHQAADDAAKQLVDGLPMSVKI